MGRISSNVLLSSLVPSLLNSGAYLRLVFLKHVTDFVEAGGFILRVSFEGIANYSILII